MGNLLKFLRAFMRPNNINDNNNNNNDDADESNE
jgi:hypothetical protein